MSHLSIMPAFAEKNNAIVMQVSNHYAPYASVTIQSIINSASDDNNYDIIILSTDMSEENAEILASLSSKNISIRIENVSAILKEYIDINDKRYGGALAVRLMLASVLFNYTIILNIDCDMIFKADIAEIFNYDMSDYYIGAVNDIYGYMAYAVPGDKKHFCKDIIIDFLGLSDISDYFNCGLFILNLEKIRQDFNDKQMFELASDKRILFLDQDIFNYMFKGHALIIDAAWNWFTDSDSFFKTHQKYLTDFDPVYAKYQEAGKSPKNIHYLASVKPWHNAAIPYANEWWKVAAQSPYYEIIVARETEDIKTIGKKRNKYLLFICETFYDLVNAINIKYHIFKNLRADLILTSSSNLAVHISKLKELKIFNNIIHTDYNASADIPTIRSKFNRKKYTINPESYEHFVTLSERYTDYFMAVATSPYQKMIYYYLVNKGIRPTVHFYEDGAENYTTKISDAVAKDGLDHSLYPTDKRFINNVKDVYIYKPELYCGGEKRRFLPIPSISESDNDFKCILHSIFGDCKMPAEKYIFFNECFSTDLRTSNDADLLDTIAEIVGKENIAVKVHPRSINADILYRLRGYKIFSDTITPWELFALSGELENKVMITVSSIAPITPFLMLNKTNYSIYLHNIMKLSQRNHATTNAYKMLIRKLANSMNAKKKCFFCPKTVKELQLIAKYLEGEIQ